MCLSLSVSLFDCDCVSAGMWGGVRSDRYSFDFAKRLQKANKHEYLDVSASLFRLCLTVCMLRI